MTFSILFHCLKLWHTVTLPCWVVGNLWERKTSESGYFCVLMQILANTQIHLLSTKAAFCLLKLNSSFHHDHFSLKYLFFSVLKMSHRSLRIESQILLHTFHVTAKKKLSVEPDSFYPVCFTMLLFKYQLHQTWWWSDKVHSPLQVKERERD